MPKIAPKSSTLSNPFIIFYNRMTRIITIWFAWILLPLLLFCFDLIPLPLTKKKSNASFHALYPGVRYLVSIYNLHRISLLTMSLLSVALG